MNGIDLRKFRFENKNQKVSLERTNAKSFDKNRQERALEKRSTR